MKIGYLIVTPKGLEALAKSLRNLNAKTARFEVHKDEDTHEEIKICCKEDAGWIDLMIS